MTATRHPQLNVEAFERLCGAHGWASTAERSRRLGISSWQLRRVIDGSRKPGADFIHAVMTAFPSAAYGDLFGTTPTAEELIAEVALWTAS